MRVFGLAMLGLAAYLAFLVGTVPASLVAARIAAETRGAVRLGDARGTLWRGQAAATVATPAGTAVLENVSWHPRVASLAAGRLGLVVHVDDSGLKGSGELARAFDSWQAHDLSVEGSATTLAHFLPLLAALRPEGSWALRAPSLRWTPSSLEGEANLEWRAAALASSEVKPLGSYRAELRGEGPQARVALSTLDGPLKLSGTGALTPQGRLTFSGEARAEPAQAAALQPLMDLLGPRRPDGSRELRLR